MCNFRASDAKRQYSYIFAPTEHRVKNGPYGHLFSQTRKEIEGLTENDSLETGRYTLANTNLETTTHSSRTTCPSARRPVWGVERQPCDSSPWVDEIIPTSDLQAMYAAWILVCRSANAQSYRLWVCVRIITLEVFRFCQTYTIKSFHL